MQQMDPVIKAATFSVCREIEGATPAPGELSAATQATRLLFNRVAGSWHSLCVLSEAATDAPNFASIVNDCAAILRCMYDAYLQAGYIALDQNKSDELGTLYLEFAYVDQYRIFQESIKKQGKGFTKRVLELNANESTEADLQRRYDAVQDHYLVGGKKKNKLRDHWYEGSLRDLAIKLDQERDYLFFLKKYHGSTHSSSLALNTNTIQDSLAVQQLAVLVVGRCAKIIVDRENIELSPEVKILFKACNQDLVKLTILDQPFIQRPDS